MLGAHAMFADRFEAGRRLAERLKALNLERPVVYALPRGGAPAGAEIAKALGAPLDVVLVRKIGAPGAPELALAAVVDGAEPQTVVNEEVRELTGASAAYLERVRTEALEEIERRRARYLGGRPRTDPQGRTAIVVDDGLATGATAKAALRALRRQGAARTVLAVPVAPIDTLAQMRAEADDVVCLVPAGQFFGVGQFYRDFHQLSDEETIEILRRAWAEPPRASPTAAGAVEPLSGAVGLGQDETSPFAG